MNNLDREKTGEVLLLMTTMVKLARMSLVLG
jgi:hypothetical protein